MDNKAQISVEYLIMMAIALILAAVAAVLATNIYAVKEGIKENIQIYRTKTIQIT